jgi:hypothetical protein
MKPTHTKQIKEHLEKYGHINPLVALNEYGCFRLGARIHELRNAGMDIKTIRDEVKGFAIYQLM